MKRIFFLVAGMLFFTAAAGVIPGRLGLVALAADKELVDINSASEKELADVHGIGVDEAKKIVKNRPYARKEDLVSKNILDERTYAKVKDKLVVGHGTAKDSTTSDMKSKVTGAIDSLTGKDKK